MSRSKSKPSKAYGRSGRYTKKKGSKPADQAALQAAEAKRARRRERNLAVSA